MDKVLAFCASVQQREQQLKVSLKSLYEQNIVDEFHIVLNWYEEVPAWLESLRSQMNPRVHLYLNPTNKHAHDSIWFKIHTLTDAYKKLNGTSFYCLTFDDDLLYPSDYVKKMIEAIDRYKKTAIITAHGSNFQRPVEDYFKSRYTYGFTDALERDVYVHMAGVGVTGFHSSTLAPHIGLFPLPYCRDLWFSMAAKKAAVPIITLQRPERWILPLKVEGDTVYDMSINNIQLKTLKNRILKEQLLPLLFCDKSNKYVLMTDYGFDRRLVDNSLRTLRLSQIDTEECNKIIFTNELQSYHPDVLTQFVTQEDFNIGRMGSKMLTQYRFMRSLPNNSKVISADCDLYYCSDPFNAFNEFDFDIGLTTRHYKYHYPINAGVVMFKLNDKVRSFLSFAMAEVCQRSWMSLIKFQEAFKHAGNDWYIDQDFWCCCWDNKEWIQKTFGITIADIGAKYNFCPHADGDETIVGKGLLLDAYEKGFAKVLHLKSRLKECLFDGDLK